MRSGVRIIPLVLLVVAACHELPIERAPERVNVEVTGSPECLATVTTALGDIDIAVAVMPVWRDGTGRMEFGPVGPAKLSQVETKLDAISCIRSIQQRACSTPDTDLDSCNTQ